MRKRTLLFLFLTIINGIIFYFRDNFQYIQYSTYDQLYKSCDENCRQKWDDYLLPYTEASMQDARQLLKPLHLDSNSALTTLKFIGHHFYEKFHQQHGYPSDMIHTSDPVNQYKILSADTAEKIWCGTYAQMLSFFAWSNNIVSRNVEIMKPGDHHVLNECYLPEQKQWIMIDVTNNILLASKNNRFLNTQDFVAGLSQPELLTVLTADGILQPISQMKELTAIQDYYKKEFPYYYYHITHAKTVYKGSAKIRRYFLPASWYEIFSPVKRFAYLFYIKLVFIVLWIILGSLILLKRIHD